MVKIFVGRLAPSVTAIQLRKLFEKYGSVSDCDILRDYGFVHMPNEEDAQRAITALDRYEFYGSRLSVEQSTSRSIKSCQLTVKNLPFGVSNEDMHKLFKKYGTVTLCKVHNDTATVHMRFPSMAAIAVRKLSGESFRGNVLSVEVSNSASRNHSWSAKPTYNGETTASVGRGKPYGTWKQTRSNYEQPTNALTSNSSNAIDSSTKPNTTSDLREGRQKRIEQGLKFLQSPLPWSGTAELYETFLNQLKEMLLDEGLELFREGAQKDAVQQLCEAINISHYMKAEGIKGHLELQDRLNMELAMMQFHMGDKGSALQYADQAFNITQGKNQSVLRFKAKLLSQCGRKTEALAFMVKCQSSINFDIESNQLLNEIKKSVGLNSNEERVPNTKGAIGDGRNKSHSQTSTFPAQPNAQPTVSLPRSIWGPTNDTLTNSSSFLPPYSEFESRSSLFDSPIREAPPTDNKLIGHDSHFQPFFNHDSSVTTPFVPQQPSLLMEKPGPITGPMSTSINPPLSILSNNFSPSLFSSDPFNYNQPQQQQPTHNSSGDGALPLPIGFRRPQTSSFSSLGGGPFLWGDSPMLGGLGINNESNVDKAADEELARAIEDELNISATNSLPYSPDDLWHNHVDQPTAAQDKNTPHYTHFPSDPTKGGYTGSVIGPAMLGIQSIAPPAPTSTPDPVLQEVSKPAAPVAVPVAEEATDENDSLSEILRNPLHDTHEFKLGCTECVLRTGSRVVDFRHDENFTHSCYKNILLCRRRGNINWLKIRPRPQPQSKAQLYDGPYYICKDLMSGQDCTYPAVCTFAYNQEEIDVWTLERKGMLNRAWLCKSMDSNFVKNLSLVGLILCKHRGSFDFLCKICFQHKPRIISKFDEAKARCYYCNSHERSDENQQLTHILRESTVRYTEIRSPLQAIMCRHAIRFQCTRGSDCHFAHSLVERDVWAIMIKEGLTAVDVVHQSREHIQKQSEVDQTNEIKSLFAPDGCLSEFRWEVKFICSLCHKNGQFNEATKDLKYCSARAQHSWSNNKKVMLVRTAKGWVQVRDLPYLKNKVLPVRFELCDHFRKQKKCSFSTKCNFAHSQEEMDIWMFLRENQFKDIEQLYDARLKQKQAKLKRAAAAAAASNKNQQSAEASSQSYFHCWLCDKEFTNKQEWDRHCLSEKHKVMATSDSDGNWKFRKPGGNYELCKKHEKNECEFDSCPQSENVCSYAHSSDELKEWLLRRQYVINRFRKAQDDQLISGRERMNDFIKKSAPHQS